MKKPEDAESPLFFVIPTEAGIQEIQIPLDSCFRRSDNFSAFNEITSTDSRDFPLSVKMQIAGQSRLSGTAYRFFEMAAFIAVNGAGHSTAFS